MLELIIIFAVISGVVLLYIVFAAKVRGKKSKFGPLNPPVATPDTSPTDKVEKKEHVKKEGGGWSDFSLPNISGEAVLWMVGIIAVIVLIPTLRDYALLGWDWAYTSWGNINTVNLKAVAITVGAVALVGFLLWKTSGMTRLIVVATAVVGFFFLNPSLLPSFSWGSSTYSTPMRIQNAAKSTLCPGELKVVELDAVPKVINPNGRCIVHYRVEGAAVLIDSQGNTLRVDEKPSNNPAFWPEYARSAQKTTVRMHYKLNAS